MSIFHWAILYALLLTLAFGLSHFLPRGSKAQKLAAHGLIVLTAGLLEAAKWAVGKMTGDK